MDIATARHILILKVPKKNGRVSYLDLDTRISFFFQMFQLYLLTSPFKEIFTDQRYRKRVV
jgi:hypothetical protein